MIENSVTGYQTKISSLQQQQEKLTWKQDAYRGITDQLIALSEKYTSYSSSTNLTSIGFFSRAVTTAANGTYANKISATGKATSEIEINSVGQLAKAARYTVAATALDFAEGALGADGVAIDWSKDVTYGNLSGSLTIAVGNSSVDVDFTAEDVYATTEDLVTGINKKLSDQKANVEATLGDGGKITFKATGDAAAAGDGVYIRSVSGSSVKSLLGAKAASSSAAKDRFSYNTLTVGNASALSTTESMAKYLSGKTVDVTLDGTTKSVTIGTLADIDMSQFSGYDEKIAELENKLNDPEQTRGMSIDESMQLKADLGAARDAKTAAVNARYTEQLAADLQSGIDKAFGAGKVTVSVNDKGGMSFAVGKDSGSTLYVASSKVGEALGLGKNGVSNYMNVGKTLGDLLGKTELNTMRMEASGEVDTTSERYFDADGNELAREDGHYYRLNSSGGILMKDGEKVAGTLDHTLHSDADGNLVKKLYDDDQYYRVNEKGEFLHDFSINGVSVGQFTEDTALESVMTAVNSNAGAGVSLSHSNLTGQFVFTARETGAGSDITFDSPLARRLFQPIAAGDKTLSDFFDLESIGDSEEITFQFGSSRMEISGVTKNMSMKELVSTLNSQLGSTKLAYDENTDSFSIASSSRYSSLSDISVWVNGTTATLGTLFADNGATYTAGQDAKINVTVNGKTMDLTRSSNTVSMDGLTVTLKGTFNEGKAAGEIDTEDKITFTTSSDADKIVHAVKGFVEAYNAVMKDVHDAYATKPLTKNSRGDKYMPLTEDDKSGMSESAVSAYEEKAKTGLLFGDSDLSSLYSRLRSIATASDLGLSAIGITSTYSDSVTQLTINEEKLRSALENDPNKVQDIFTRSKENGAASDGLMARFKSVYNTYASKSYGSYGILVNKAGTKLASLSLMSNSMQKQIDNLDKQIDSWQTKLSNRIDYYTKQFTALEKLMSTMNNQSSMLADMMGY